LIHTRNIKLFPLYYTYLQIHKMKRSKRKTICANVPRPNAFSLPKRNAVENPQLDFLADTTTTL